MTGAKDISMDAVVAAVLSELDGIFAFKEEKKKVLRSFLGFSESTFLTPDWQSIRSSSRVVSLLPPQATSRIHTVSSTSSFFQARGLPNTLWLLLAKPRFSWKLVILGRLQRPIQRSLCILRTLFVSSCQRPTPSRPRAPHYDHGPDGRYRSKRTFWVVLFFFQKPKPKILRVFYQIIIFFLLQE